MRRALGMLVAAAALAALALLAVVTTSATSAVEQDGQTLLVGNALRASDLTAVGTTSGTLVIDDAGCWALDHDGTVQPLRAPGGSSLKGGKLVAGAEQFSVGDSVELQGGTGPGDESCGGADTLYFWQLRSKG